MRRFCVCVVSVAMLLSLAACGVKMPSVGETAPSSSESTDTTQLPEATDALSELRGDMKPPVMAVADLGFPKLSENFEILDYLLDVRIKDEEDLTGMFDLPMLGRIPNFNDSNKKKDARYGYGEEAEGGEKK